MAFARAGMHALARLHRAMNPPPGSTPVSVGWLAAEEAPERCSVAFASLLGLGSPRCVWLEHAVIRGVPGQETRVGDNVLVGPHAHLTGCVIEGGSRIATGAMVFACARIETGAEVEFNAVVYVNTVVPADTAVPMGWFARGQPAELVAPDDWERIRAIMGPLDYPGTVFGVGASSLMPDIARRGRSRASPNAG